MPHYTNWGDDDDEEEEVQEEPAPVEESLKKFKPVEPPAQTQFAFAKKSTWGIDEEDDGEPMYESNKDMKYGSPQYLQKFGGAECIKLRKEKVIEAKHTYLPRGLRLKQEL